MELVFCTNNAHKIKEVSQIMGSEFHFLRMQDVGYFEEIPEPFDSLEANSATKANTIYFFCNKSCFAEDTGLFIEALGGEPGVFAARYAGEPSNPKNNIQKVLSKLGNNQNRNAFFKTVITLVTARGEWQFEGICKGKISMQVGGEDGFGYDPIFVPDGYTNTFAELDASIKNEISHRKKAFEKFANFLNSLNK